jgi:hypothetical protein
MTFAVVQKFAPALAMGSVAELGYVIGAVTFYFSDTLGVPASLAIAGLLILSMAAAAAHWHWFARPAPPPVPPGAGGTSEQPRPRELTPH